MITNAILTNTAANVVYGTPTQNNAVTCIQACNITNAAGFEVPSTVNIDVYLVPAGQTVGTQNLIYSKVPITAGDTFIVDAERMVLGDGDAVWAGADINGAIVFTVSTVGI
jgi:hypothetical protein